MGNVEKYCRKQSHLKVDKQTRRQEILSVFEAKGRMTARECKEALGYTDFNAVRPRINELRNLGKLKESGTKYDPVSDRVVTAYERV